MNIERKLPLLMPLTAFVLLGGLSFDAAAAPAEGDSAPAEDAAKPDVAAETPDAGAAEMDALRSELEALRADLDYLNPRIGGQTTLVSYGAAPEAPPAEAARHVPEGHRAFLADLPSHHLRGEVLFVHAGIRPGIGLEEQTAQDMAWIRAPFLDYEDPHPWLVVHGHTHRPEAEHCGNRVNIDSSAAYGGPLTAVVVEGRDVWLLGPEGRIALTPRVE